MCCLQISEDEALPIEHQRLLHYDKTNATIKEFMEIDEALEVLDFHDLGRAKYRSRKETHRAKQKTRGH
eukprot:11930318-Prorocentrum_lima.AAC.1